MSKSVKAALLSALVFPGVGHFLLKKPVQGVLLSGAALVCVYSLVSTALEIAQAISAKIQSGEVPLDVAKINELVSKQLTVGDGQLINIPTLLLAICWVVGIVDSYKVGREQVKNENGTRKKT